jgi:hypothetical protein
MLEQRGLGVKRNGEWYIRACCGRCNGIDDACNPAEYKLHPSDHENFDLIHKHVQNPDIWTFYILREEEDFVGGCGHTGYPTYTTYAKLSNKLEPPNFIDITELDKIIDF